MEKLFIFFSTKLGLLHYLASPPVLVAPVQKEPLLLYIMATNQVVSAVLVGERGAPPKQSSKGKRPRNPFPGQSSKKRRPGGQGFEDPSTPTPSIIIEPNIEGDEGIQSEATQPGATPTTSWGAEDVEDTEPAKGSATRKVQHLV